MKAYFQKLFRYNQWANEGLSRHLRSLPGQLDEVQKRMSHIVAAEEVWYQRIEPLDLAPLPLFKIQTWEVLQPRLEASALRWLDLVDQTRDFERAIDYRNQSGRSYASLLSDIMIHLANHGTYHRGQIATLLRQQGQEPLATDYIVYCREQGA